MLCPYRHSHIRLLLAEAMLSACCVDGVMEVAGFCVSCVLCTQFALPLAVVPRPCKGCLHCCDCWLCSDSSSHPSLCSWTRAVPNRCGLSNSIRFCEFWGVCTIGCIRIAGVDSFPIITLQVSALHNYHREHHHDLLSMELLSDLCKPRAWHQHCIPMSGYLHQSFS